MSLYPLKFKTIYKEKIWGGHKIKTHLNKDFSPLENCGETWEISGVAGDVSIVDRGELSGKSLTDLIHTFKADLVGSSVYEKFGNEFPLLIKFIDANADLSVQVHPNDDLAQDRHDTNGKTEMWYIFQADKNSTLISGFNRPLSKDSFQQYFNNGALDQILNKEKVSAGDVFFIPAGRVHTIGKGILLAEIQQTSDVTYRIYDFDRVDKDGNKRELHQELALDAITYEHGTSFKTKYVDSLNEPIQLVENCNYFETNKFIIDQEIERNYDRSSFRIFICYSGAAKIITENGSYDLVKGDVILIPAVINSLTIKPIEKTEFLETYIP